MSFVGPLYIFSKHDNFLYLLSTIDGEVIKQMFHVSRLKRGLLRLPKGKSVKNINDYKLEMIRLRNDIKPQPAPDVTDNSQTSVKSVLHHHVNEFTPISGVNHLQFSRTLFLTEGTIYCISIMPITECNHFHRCS